MTGKLIAPALLALVPMAGQAQQVVDYTLSAYLWFPTTSTDVATRWGTASTEISAKDALDALDFGFMLNGSARSGKWNFIGDVIYLDMSADADTPFGTLYSRVTTATRLTSLIAYALYAVYQTPQSLMELGGGLRAMSVDLDLTFAPGALPQARRGVEDSWAAPVIAAKFTRQFNDKWYGSLLLDYGGFGGGGRSNESWQAVAILGYRVSENWTVLGSYRHLRIDRAKDGHDYQLELSGPLLGVSYRF